MKFYLLFQLFFISWSCLAQIKTNTVCLLEGSLSAVQSLKGADSEESLIKNLALQANLSKEDILTRLILSESLSTGYWASKDPDLTYFKENILRKIAAGVRLRIKNPADTQSVYNTVFLKNNFRTSFTPKKDNPFAKTFLCPLEMGTDYLTQVELANKINMDSLIQMTFEIAHEVLSTPIQDEYKSVTNFFYPQSPIFGDLNPKWALDTYLILNLSNDWIKMFHVP